MIGTVIVVDGEATEACGQGVRDLARFLGPSRAQRHSKRIRPCPDRPHIRLAYGGWQCYQIGKRGLGVGSTAWEAYAVWKLINRYGGFMADAPEESEGIGK